MTAVAWAIAFLLSFVLSGAVARGGPVDPVRDRGEHRRPTPTTGGLAILAATCAGAAVAGAADAQLAAALAAAALLGAYAALDDLSDFGAGPKLAAQMIAALAFAVGVAAVTRLPFAPDVAVSMPWIVGVIGTAFWLIVFGNVVNFMDGADGLAAGAVAIASAAVAVVALFRFQPAIAAAAAGLAAANVGFLPWNLGRRLFQGDVGALFSSLLLAALGVLLAVRGAASPWLVPLAALPLLADALGTLMLRLARREPVWRPHKQHLYHLWLAAGRGGHLSLSARVWLLTAVCASAAALAELQAPDWTAAVFGAAVLLSAALWLSARRSLRSPA